MLKTNKTTALHDLTVLSEKRNPPLLLTELVRDFPLSNQRQPMADAPEKRTNSTPLLRLCNVARQIPATRSPFRFEHGLVSRRARPVGYHILRTPQGMRTLLQGCSQLDRNRLRFGGGYILVSERENRVSRGSARWENGNGRSELSLRISNCNVSENLNC